MSCFSKDVVCGHTVFITIYAFVSNIFDNIYYEMKSSETNNTTNLTEFEDNIQFFVIQSINDTLKFPDAIRT